MTKKKKHNVTNKHTTINNQTTYAIDFQSQFKCSNCGLCCRTEWRIQIEQSVRNNICEHLKNNTLQLASGKEADIDSIFIKEKKANGEEVIILGKDENGNCPFLEIGESQLCGVHRQLGVSALAAICRLYPRLCILSPKGTYISLSHFCPTVADILFEDNQEISIVENPSAFPSLDKYEGLDARKHLPPLLRPNVLMTFETYDMWERYAIGIMARKEYTPEEALIVLCITAEKLRNAANGNTVNSNNVKNILEQDMNANPEIIKSEIQKLPSRLQYIPQYYANVLAQLESESSVFHQMEIDFNAYYLDDTKEESRNFEEDYAAYIRPIWKTFEVPIRKYLASKLFANYFAYQGNGLRTGLFAVIIAYNCLRLHATILCIRENKMLDKEILFEAIRLTDLLLVHLISKSNLIQYFNMVEDASIYELIASIPD